MLIIHTRYQYHKIVEIILYLNSQLNILIIVYICLINDSSHILLYALLQIVIFIDRIYVNLYIIRYNLTDNLLLKNINYHILLVFMNE